MSDLQFVNPEYIHLFWLVLILVIWLFQQQKQQFHLMDTLIAKSLQLRLITRRRSKDRRLQLLCFTLMLCFGIIAIMRPQTIGGNEQVSTTRSSADLMIVLDLSKSMLAEDAPPNRLNRAKSEITELVDQLTGHRVGLIGFAGAASVLCPLTTDYGFFSLTLSNATPNSINRGGTNIGSALQKAIAAFGPSQSARLILLITDGEDHDSYPMEAAQLAKDLGIRIVSIGFGSEQGSEITITDPQTGAKSTLLDRSGNVVLSRLDGEMLRDIALLSEGAYVPAGTAALDLESIASQHIEPIFVSDQQIAKVQPKEQYAIFVFLSLLFLVCTIWLGTQPHKVTA